MASGEQKAGSGGEVSSRWLDILAEGWNSQLD